MQLDGSAAPVADYGLLQHISPTIRAAVPPRSIQQQACTHVARLDGRLLNHSWWEIGKNRVEIGSNFCARTANGRIK